MHIELRTLPVADLIPADYNPRTVTQPAYRKLKASLERFGLVEPLIWNQRTGRVVGGHLRLRIIRELGYTEVPVSVVDLDDTAEKALNIILNNQEAQGRYDPSKLAAILGELNKAKAMEDTGFDDSTLRNLTIKPLAEMPPEAESDRVEVTLEADNATFESMQPRLEDLIREFDLVSHVKRK
ncbi:hypothetical protein BH11PLA2_BH11PLA2_26620 [soil metagenome]